MPFVTKVFLSPGTNWTRTRSGRIDRTQLANCIRTNRHDYVRCVLELAAIRWDRLRQFPMRVRFPPASTREGMVTQVAIELWPLNFLTIRVIMNEPTA